MLGEVKFLVILNFNRRAIVTWEELIDYNNILRVIFWGGIYLWTILSWQLGLYGAFLLTTQVFRLFRDYEIVYDKETDSPQREYGKVKPREFMSSFMYISLLAAWWVMMLR